MKLQTSHNKNFKLKHSFQERLEESIRIIKKYPDKIPVICEKSIFNKNDNIPIIDKFKYLVPNDLTIGQFLYVIRNKMKLQTEKAIFLYINGIIPSNTTTISKIYFTHKDQDGFLYMTYSGENVFG